VRQREREGEREGATWILPPLDLDLIEGGLVVGMAELEVLEVPLDGLHGVGEEVEEVEELAVEERGLGAPAGARGGGRVCEEGGEVAPDALRGDGGVELQSLRQSRLRVGHESGERRGDV
jgi:hypothetical protein